MRIGRATWHVFTILEIIWLTAVYRRFSGIFWNPHTALSSEVVAGVAAERHCNLVALSYWVGEALQRLKGGRFRFGGPASENFNLPASGQI